ncbi:uncharacterized membrane protein YbhN (UPF0104 family) [Bacillus fengqiuensis]|nr:uncharacterized membrane protein YbhN (UPF0104 family) [Bacillus fengqiuensis]
MKPSKKFFFVIGVLLVLLFGYVSLQAFDWKKLQISFSALWIHPLWLLFMIFFYTGAFWLRAVAWRMYMNGKITLSSALAALFYSLALNHLFPVKAGDMVRVGVIHHKNKSITMEEAVHSVVIMRVLDMLCLLGISAFGVYMAAGYVRFQLQAPFLWAGVVLFVCLLGLILKKYSLIWRKQVTLLKESVLTKRFPLLLLLIFISWACEGAVVYSTVHAIGHSLSAIESIWVNSMTVGGQIFQITPGGIGTYETVMSGALVLLSLPLEDSYTIALTSHAYKFIYSYAAGVLVLLFMPVTMKQLRMWIRKKGEEPL